MRVSPALLLMPPLCTAHVDASGSRRSRPTAEGPSDASRSAFVWAMISLGIALVAVLVRLAG